MHNGIKNTFIFVLGAAVGVAASWKFLEMKFKKISDEEVNSVKDFYANRGNKCGCGDCHCGKQSDPIKGDTETNTEEEGLTQEDYEDLVSNEGYFNYSNIDKKEKGGDQMATKKNLPYIITPEDFGEHDDYDTVSLTYYADGVLTDDYSDEEIEDPDELVGPDFAEHFGEYEDDSVFVRNDILKTDYEILYDTRKYSDVKADEYK